MWSPRTDGRPCLLVGIFTPGQLCCFCCTELWTPGLSAGTATPAKGTLHSTAAWSVASGSHAGLCNTGRLQFNAIQKQARLTWFPSSLGSRETCSVRGLAIFSWWGAKGTQGVKKRVSCSFPSKEERVQTKQQRPWNWAMGAGLFPHLALAKLHPNSPEKSVWGKMRVKKGLIEGY